MKGYPRSIINVLAMMPVSVPQKCRICESIWIMVRVRAGWRKLSGCWWLVFIRINIWAGGDIPVGPVWGRWLVLVVVVRFWYPIVRYSAHWGHGGVVRVVVGRLSVLIPAPHASWLPWASTATAARGAVRAVDWSLDEAVWRLVRSVHNIQTIIAITVCKQLGGGHPELGGILHEILLVINELIRIVW